MRQNKYDKRDSKYRAWYTERDKLWKKYIKIFENSAGIHVNFPSLWSKAVADFSDVDKRYGLSDDNREVWTRLWNKVLANLLLMVLTKNMTVSVVVKRFLLV